MELTLGITSIVKKERGTPSAHTADVDRDAVDRVRGGDRRAFDELVRRHQQALFYLCLRYLKNDADAADLTQRAFVKAYNGLETFRGSSAFRTWLYRIAINLCLNHIRDHRRERAADIREDALVHNPTGPLRIIEDQRSRSLREAIAELPPKQRMVLELRIYDELPFKEVAVLAECTENAAKVNFHHAVKKLRARLSAAADERDEGTDERGGHRDKTDKGSA